MKSSLQNVHTPGFKKGDKNPNFKDGRSIRKKVCPCGRQTNDYRNKLCLKCYRSKMGNRNRTTPWRGVVPLPRKGEASNFWKGSSVGYKGIHIWLNTKFGKARKCENKKCKMTSKYFDYSLLRGKKYLRKRENFWQLCRSCHKYYDKKK